MSGKVPRAGTCEFLRFFSDRVPKLDACGFAVLAALLMHVNTGSRRRAELYQAHPSHRTLAKVARVSEPTVRKALKRLEQSGWIRVTKRRAGRFNDSNLYDFTPAAEQIIVDRQRKRAPLKSTEGGNGDT